ncbi:MAG TPA: tetratricopeptide repeat protein [Ktedonobacterales bacterium]|jgi:predicted ATPase/DNA-binding XRE family transcriptional regulator
MASFGHLLRRYRIRRGLTQEELAESASISARSITDLERGVSRNPHKNTVILLADALQLAQQERVAFLEAARGREASSPPAQVIGLKRLLPPLTSLIGREREEAVLARLLQQERVRLLTLTGPAGVGKTRMAMQVALTVQEDFPDGVSFIELAPLRDPAQLIPTITQHLRVPEHGATPLEETLMTAIGDRQMLLILDNMEQILPAAPNMSRLLLQCPQLKMLVTSRAALLVRGEYRYSLAPLAFPDPDRMPALAETISYPAVALFCQRAQAISPDFSVNTQVDAQTIAQLCRHLDGLPLAIELAAARLNLFSPRALLQHLTNVQGTSPLDILSSPIQDLPDRQQSARAAIRWSYELLNAQEQHVFHALCLFESGATLAALRAVAECDEAALLSTLASLVDKSLILRDERDQETLRFTCLELLRAFGVERLHALGVSEPQRARFAAYYLLLAKEAERGIPSSKQEYWLSTLDHELPHFRAALQWFLEHTQIKQGLRLSAALTRYWTLRGFLSEGRRWLEGFLSQANENSLAPEASRALLCVGDLAYRQGAYKESRTFCEQGLSLCHTLQSVPGTAFALCLLGRVDMDQSYYQEAEDQLQQGLKLFRMLGDPQGQVFALNLLGATHLYQEQVQQAVACYEEALALARQLGDLEQISRSLNDLGTILRATERQRAISLLQESRRLGERIGSRAGSATILSHLGHDAFEHGEFAQAAGYHRASLQIRREVGDVDGVAFSLCNLANAVREVGNEVEATRLFLEALPLILHTGSRRGVARLLEGLATGACVAGQLEEAVRLWGQAEEVRRVANCPDSLLRSILTERHFDAARQVLGQERYEAAFRTGVQTSYAVILEGLHLRSHVVAAPHPPIQQF